MIRLYSDSDRERWDSFVMASGGSTCYHLIGWKDVIEASFSHKTHYLLSEGKDGNINGILPLVHLKSMLFGNFMVSLPYFNYGGVCTDDDEVHNQLIKEAINIAGEVKAEHIELRHTHHIQGLQEKTSKVSMILDLPYDPDVLWNNFSSNLRRKIRKPEKEGMYLKLGGEEELDNFYTVFSVNMRDLGTPVYSKCFFSNILKAFPKNSRIHTVYDNKERPVASAILIGFKERIEMPWVSSIKSYNRYYPNTLLYWGSLKFASELGYKLFDFGRSTPGEGTFRFKEQWGAKPIQLYWQYWIRNGGSLPNINPKNPKYQTAIRIWQKLPVKLTSLIGPYIVKNLP